MGPALPASSAPTTGGITSAMPTSPIAIPIDRRHLLNQVGLMNIPSFHQAAFGGPITPASSGRAVRTVWFAIASRPTGVSPGMVRDGRVVRCSESGQHRERVLLAGTAWQATLPGSAAASQGLLTRT